VSIYNAPRGLTTRFGEPVRGTIVSYADDKPSDPFASESGFDDDIPF
jgi:hypothetical protein